MNFQELVDAVALRTGYGHLNTLLVSLCKSALLKLHNTEQFPQDLKQSVVTAVPSSDLKFSVNLPADFRSFESVKINFPDSSYLELPYRQLSWIKANPYGTDYFTIVGNALSVNLATSASTYQLTYYANPVIAEPYSSATSWVLQQHADAVVSEACALVFEAVELFDRAQIERNSGRIFMQQLVNVGYQPQAFEAIGEE